MKANKLIGLIVAIVAVMFILTACEEAVGTKKAGTPYNQNLNVQQGNLEIAGTEEKKDEKDEQKIYTVAELFESGEITRQDLLDMAYNVNGGIVEENKDQYPEGYVPKLIQPEVLDEETEENIIATLKTEKEQGFIKIMNYYGTYNDYIIVCYMDGGVYIDVELSIVYNMDVVDGIAFAHWIPERYKLAVYKNK